MGDSLASLDLLVRGMGVGAMLILGISSWRSATGRDARFASLFAGVSVAAWIATESDRVCGLFGHDVLFLIPAYPVAGAFWLFIAVVFADMRVSALTLAPSALLFVTGLVMTLSPPQISEPLWAVRNLAGAALSGHGIYMVARSWRGDLVEGRRRLRGPLLGTGALFGVFEVAIAFGYRLFPSERWLLFDVGEPYGGLFVTVLAVLIAALFTQARPEVFGASRRPEPAADARALAADGQLLTKLTAFMTGDGWRQEGLTIGELSRQLGEPEHRLRRLINQRLGHRNFADFVNGYRIEAAKARLSDPAQARTTVAVIAFDLGYGSLGPFNRAFRAATGVTPSAWRRQALAASPDLLETA